MSKKMNSDQQFPTAERDIQYASLILAQIDFRTKPGVTKKFDPSLLCTFTTTQSTSPASFAGTETRMYRKKKDSQIKVVPSLDGLAISYEPPIDRMGWANNEVPLTRSIEPTSKIRYDSVAYDRASCVDSLLDAYLYSETSVEEDEEDEAWHNDNQEEVEEYDLHSSNHHNSNFRIVNEAVRIADGAESRPLDSRDESEVKPWDTRGKNGLYGGGGRGAENKETGWAIDSYANDSANTTTSNAYSTHSLHLHKAQESPDIVEESRNGSRVKTSNINHHQNSSESDQSQYGPLTPVGAAFPRGSNPSFLNSSPEAPSDLMRSSTASSRPNTAIQNRKASAPAVISLESGSRKIKEVEYSERMPPRRKSEPILSHHGNRKKSAPPPPLDISKSKGASTPLIASPLSPLASAALHAESRRRKSANGFSWNLNLNRKSKTPIISNPILPLGFIESLGMATFELNNSSVPPLEPPRVSILNQRSPTKKVRKLISKESMKAAIALEVHEKDSVEEVITDSPKSSVTDFRQEISSVFSKRQGKDDGGISEGSSNYTQGSVIGGLAEEDLNRQLYFNGLRNQENKAKIPGPISNRNLSQPPRNLSLLKTATSAPPFSTFSASDSDSYSNMSHVTDTTSTTAVTKRSSNLREESRASYLTSSQKTNSYSKLSSNSSRPPSSSRSGPRRDSPNSMGELGRRPSHEYGGKIGASSSRGSLVAPAVPPPAIASNEGGWQPGW